MDYAENEYLKIVCSLDDSRTNVPEERIPNHRLEKFLEITKAAMQCMQPNYAVYYIDVGVSSERIAHVPPSSIISTFTLIDFDFVLSVRV